MARIYICSGCKSERISGKPCKPCAIVRVRAWQAANPERNKKMHADRYIANKEDVRLKGIAYRNANAEQCKARSLAYRRAHPNEWTEELKAKRAARHAADPEKRSAAGRARYAANKELIGARAKAARLANPDRKRIANIKYAEKHAGDLNAKTARRRSKKLRATPPWADSDLTKDFYKLAAVYTRVLGRTFHIDHIVPLQSKFVCGLHTPENLQVLEFMENVLKSNRVWPDMSSLTYAAMP